MLKTIRRLIQKLIQERANARKHVDGGQNAHNTKRRYTLRRAQNRKNTKGASAKKGVPGRSK